MFSVNQTYHNKKQTIKLRICHVSIALAKLAVIDLIKLQRTKLICKPKTFKFDDFAKFIKDNKLIYSIEMLPAWINFDDKKLKELGKESWIEKRDKKLQLVKSLLNEKTIYSYLYGSGVGEQIKALLATQNVWKKSSNYYRQLNRYICFGCVNNALLPINYENCGSNYYIPQNRAQRNIKRGRKTKYAMLGEYPALDTYSASPGITQEEIKVIKKLATKVTTSARKNITARARLLYRRENECRFVDEPGLYGTNKKIIWDDETECLSESQFRYHFHKFLSEEDKIKAAKGQIVFDKDHKQRSASTWEYLIGPTHLYEIDATILDIHVRYPYSDNEQLSMGRPVLYVVVDVFSTCIVGMYIGFHGPDWLGAAEALINSFLDKQSFAARFGLEISKKDWPCHHLCHSINSDNGGEYSLKNISSLLKANLGIDEWMKTRSYMGVAKAVSERKFGIFNDSFLHYQPGAIYEVRRDEQDPSQNALWDLESLYGALISEIIFYNHTSIRENHHNFKASKMQVGMSPQALFDFFIEEEMAGGNPTTSEDEGRIRLACLPEGEAMVTPQGVRFQGLFYTSPYAESAKWYFQAKNFGHFNIYIKWSRSSVNSIWYQTDDNKVIEFKIKADKSQRYEDQIWEAVAIRQEQYAREKHNAKRERSKKELEKDNYQQQLLANNLNQISRLPKNTSKSRQTGIQERKESQAKIEKAEINNRNQAAISTIASSVISSEPSSHSNFEQSHHANSLKKKKKVSLNTLLQTNNQKDKK